MPTMLSSFINIYDSNDSLIKTMDSVAGTSRDFDLLVDCSLLILDDTYYWIATVNDGSITTISDKSYFKIASNSPPTCTLTSYNGTIDNPAPMTTLDPIFTLGYNDPDGDTVDSWEAFIYSIDGTLIEHVTGGTIAGHYPNGDYYWNGKVKDSRGLWGPLSDNGYFRVTV